MADEADKETADTGDAQAPDAPAGGDQPEQAAGQEAPEAQAEEAAEATAAPEAQDEGAATPDSDAGVGDGGEGVESGDLPAAEQAGGADAPAGGGSESDLSPKEARRRRRSRHVGEARPPRSAEQRHAERLAERARKALRRRARRAKARAKAAERRAATPAREPLAPLRAQAQGSRRERQGIVVSDKAEKTITVRIDVARRHRRYEKIVRSSSTLHAHDENNEAHIGDLVRVIESRPLSKSKRWRLLDVLERAR